MADINRVVATLQATIGELSVQVAILQAEVEERDARIAELEPKSGTGLELVPETP